MVSAQSKCKEVIRSGLPSCLGFQIHSSSPLKLIRAGGGNGTLEVRADSDLPNEPTRLPLLEWKLQGTSHDIIAKLYECGDSYRFCISDIGSYRINPVARTIHIPEGGDEIIREHRLWTMPTLLCAMHRGDFFLHAAVVEVDGGAILLAAPGRHGKTTLALAFHREGYRVLSEDSACCRLESFPVLVPGPALLRIRPDMFKGRAPAGTHVISEYEDRIFLALDENRRGSDDPVPIRAIVFLRESTNEIHIESVARQRAIPDLWALNFHLPNEASRAQSFRQLTGLISNVPVWNIYRPLRIASLTETVARISKLASSLA
jgi:hypothetical protein